MKGNNATIGNEIRGVRSKVTGRRPVGIRNKKAKEPEPEPELDDGMSPTEAEKQFAEESMKVQEHKKKSQQKIENYIKTKLDAERNKRLRSGNPLTREERTSLASSLRATAEAKYLNKMVGSAVSSPERPKGEDARLKAALEQQAAEMMREREKEMQDLRDEVELLQTHELQHARSQAAMDPEATMDLGDASEHQHRHASATQDNAGFMHSTPRSLPDDAQAHHAGDGMPSPLNKSEHTPANDGGDKGKDQEWWAAEQAKWKADMQGGPNERTGTNETPQKDDIDAAQRSRRELLPQFDASVAGDQDSKKVIRLRTYTISKQYASEALGVQFYTPEQGPGVRITAMNEAGPFGRCGDLEDDDVLVEINGHPVLYAGHAGVIACIKEALHSSNQMSITVCRPVELNKLEDLKQTTKIEEQIKSKTGPWSKFKKKLGGIITPKPAGRIKGAPAWWSESAKKGHSDTQSECSDASDRSAMTARTERTVTLRQPKAVHGDNMQDEVPSQYSNVPAVPANGEPKQSAAYLIYRADVRDLEAYKHNYMDVTTALIKQFGGKWLARGGKITTLEGGDASNKPDLILQRMVLIEFPNMDAAKAFFHSEEYQEARQQRLSIATAELTVLEGMPLGMN